MILRKLILPLALVFIALVFFFSNLNINWSNDNWKSLIRSDAKCYYAYLPAVFVYKDLNFGFIDSVEYHKYYDPNNFRDIRMYVGDNAVNKVTIGTALAQLPFFTGAQLYAKDAGFGPDGYSKPYQLSVTLAAIFYLIVGLFFLNLVLYRLNIGAGNRALVLMLCAFATNLYYYTIGEPGLSHVYSFAFVNIFAWTLMRFFDDGRSRFLFTAAAAFGIIVMIRPVNAILLLSVPFFAGHAGLLKQRIAGVFRKPWSLLLAVLLFLFPVALQSLVFYIQCGHFWIYTYGNEHFDFSHPHMMDVLFSFKKGLFLYTPLYLVSLFGLPFLYRFSKWRTYCLAGFLLVFTFIISSWWSWWYGGSFSSRVYVDILMFFMIPLGFLLQNVRRIAIRTVLMVMLFLLVALCQIQTYQYRYYQIHWENMTREKYFEVFLRIDKI